MGDISVIEALLMEAGVAVLGGGVDRGSFPQPRGMSR